MKGVGLVAVVDDNARSGQVELAWLRRGVEWLKCMQVEMAWRGASGDGWRRLSGRILPNGGGMTLSCTVLTNGEKTATEVLCCGSLMWCCGVDLCCGSVV